MGENDQWKLTNEIPHAKLKTFLTTKSALAGIVSLFLQGSICTSLVDMLNGYVSFLTFL